jgi:hypothetical protein
MVNNMFCDTSYVGCHVLTKISSTEEMCAKIKALNKELEAEEPGLTPEQLGLLKEVVVSSKDAIYPSLEAAQSAEII